MVGASPQLRMNQRRGVEAKVAILSVRRALLLFCCLQFPLATMATSGPCNVCKNTSSSRCSRCKAVFYCGAEHQKADWPTHSKQCKAASAASAAASPAKTAWNPPKVVSAPVAKGTLESIQSSKVASMPDTIRSSFVDHVATFRRWLEENGVKGLDKVGIADFEQTGMRFS